MSINSILIRQRRINMRLSDAGREYHFPAISQLSIIMNNWIHF